MWLSRLSIDRPVFMTMVVGVMMLLGLVALTRLPVNLFPEVSLPVITAVLPYPGASPEQVEEEVVKPIEDAVAGLQGLDEIIAFSRENVGIVVLRFSMSTDVERAASEVRDRVYGARALMPDGVNDPIFQRIDPAATPVMTLALAADMDSVALRQLAEETIRPRVERVEGVGAAQVIGGDTREVQVELDMPALAALRIPLTRVLQLVGYDIVDIPGGNISSGPGTRMGVRSVGRVESLDELGGVVLQGFPDPIYLRDVAELVDGVAEAETLSRVDGRRAVTLQVVKEAGTNTVAVCDGVREELASIEADIPGVRVQPVIDTSRMVRDMYHEMQRALLIGAAMAILVVFLFLVDWRSTFISALALPTSVVTTFFFMWVAGFSLNLLTLLAMALAIGILIDDAVVVREVIYRHQERGESPLDAALGGTKEVALAVLATTSAILAVFIPVGFVGGMVGQFFSEFGLTIAIAVAVSLFIAFTVDPMLSVRMSLVTPYEQRSRLSRAVLDFWAGVDDAYRRLLAWALDHGGITVLIATVLFVGSLGMVYITGFEFIPKYDRDQFQVQLSLPSVVDLQGAEQRASEVEDVLFALPEVTHVYTVVGVDGAVDRVDMRVLTTPKNNRDLSVFELLDMARAQLSLLPGITASVTDAPLIEGAQMGSAIEVEIRGRDLDAMVVLERELRTRMRGVPGAADIRSSWRPGRPEIVVDVQRDQAAAAGLSVGQVGFATRVAVAGQVVGSMRDDGRSVDIRLRARPEDRTPDTLLSSVLLLSPLPRMDDPWGRGTPVSMADVAEVRYSEAPTLIKRRDRQRVLELSASTQGRHLSDVTKDVEAIIDELQVPEGIEVLIRGEAEVAADALKDLLLALALAVAFVYAVLASQFESFIHPFTIMISLPLAVVGAFAVVFMVGWPIGILTMLGIILLMGLVVKNAILLVDRTNQLRDQGHGVRDALLEAGHVRLRPILMTSLAMILGMTPPAIATGAGSEIQQPMAVPVIGGLVASTLLTLVVVPVVYQWIERFRERGTHES